MADGVEIVPVLQDNYAYLVFCPETRQAAAIDPADPEAVAERAQRRGLTVTAIWNTHHHADHSGGNLGLIEQLGPLEVVAHRADAPRVPGLTRAVDDGDTLSLGSVQATVVHVPGHTLGGAVFVVGDAAFTGDALFGAGCGRLFEGDAAMLYSSLNERLARALTALTKLYWGHEYTLKNLRFAADIEPGNAATQHRLERVEQLRVLGSVPSTWGEELETNPFLRCDSPAIRAALRERFPGEKLESSPEVFARLRSLRDRW